MRHHLLLLVFGIGVTGGQNCARSPCPNHLYSHYYVKNCTPQGYDPCCPTSFSCPPFRAPRDSCLYRGVSYGLRNDVPVQDPCSASCYCREGFPKGGPAVIECAQVECPSLFRGPLGPNCRYVHQPGQCCEVDTKCGTPTLRDATCTYNGTVYLEGDEMYFDDLPCQTCVCGSQYSGPFGPGCEAISCGLDFRYTQQLAKGCTPIIFEEGCCPIEWLCPDDKRLPQGQSQGSQGGDCVLGDLEVKRGDVIDLGDCKLVCGCLTPPELTCNKYRSCDLAQKNKLFPFNLKP